MSIIAVCLAQIEPDTGVISSKQPVDYETHPYIEFEVLAKDGGTPAQFNTTAVLIVINDVNDVHPEFQCVHRAEDDPYPRWQNCFYNLELRSDTDIGHVVLQLLSTDNDTVTRKMIDSSLVACFHPGWCLLTMTRSHVR